MPGNIPGYGKWDYNDDGVQDTLMVPDCGVNGCSMPWADTIAGGFGAQQAGQLYNYLGVGPFRLNAGDTTEFIWFLGRGMDTATTMRIVRSVTDAYLAGFSDLAAPPAPTFTANEVHLTSAFARDTQRTAEVRIEIKMPTPARDGYLTRALTRLQSSDPSAADVRRLNPGIVATVEQRASQNLARVLVLKSCDHGKTWTDASGTCASAAAARSVTVSGTASGLGWQAFRVIPADTLTGALASRVVTDVVPAGQEYLYSLVTQSRSLADVKVVYQESIDAGGTVTSRKLGSLFDALGVDVDTVTGPLATLGATTVSVYAPVSVPAGTILARVDTATVQGQATNAVVAIARTARATGMYRMQFGNRFIITRTLDTLSGARTSSIVRQSLYACVAAQPNDGTPLLNFVAAADTFSAPHDFYYSASTSAPAVALRTTPRLIVGSVQVFVDTISAAGYVVASAATREPYFLAVSGTSTGFTSIAENLDPYEGTRAFPGLTSRVATGRRTATCRTTSARARARILLAGSISTCSRRAAPTPMAPLLTASLS